MSSTPSPSSTGPVPSLRVSAGFLTARYDCTWPPPAQANGREVRAPQEAWTNVRKTAAPVDTSRYRYTNSALHGGGTAYLIQSWRQDRMGFVRVKAQLTGPRSVRIWVTVPDVPDGYDQASRAAATPTGLVRKYLTVSRSQEGDIPGSCRISEGGKPLPPQDSTLDDDTTGWR